MRICNIVEKPGRLGRTWKDNIKIYLKGVMFENVEWLHMVQKKGDGHILVSRITKLWIPLINALNL
jgi:hypothetical protein